MLKQPESMSTRRAFIRTLTAASAASITRTGAASQSAPAAASGQNRERMRSLAAWTALTFDTPEPVPFGADILNTATGERLMRAANAVGSEHDPSAHAEVRTIRLACAKLATPSLRGYTLYTTCEPCPMCMACALWAGLDRVVYGATIEDAAHFGSQIFLSATELASRGQLRCEVTGLVERDACYALFTNPKVMKAMERWKAHA